MTGRNDKIGGTPRDSSLVPLLTNRDSLRRGPQLSSAQVDLDNCFNKLQLRWTMLRNHRDTDLYWFFEDDPAFLSKNSGIITEWLLLLVELDIPTPSGVKWTGHSLRRGGASAAHAIGVSIADIIHGLGLMEVSRFSAPLHRRLCAPVFRSSLLLRPPACVLPTFIKRHSFDKLLQML
jgi:hypothetical protein